MAPTTQASAPDPSLIFDTLLAYQRAAALRAAIELDVFAAIGEGCTDVESIARRCAASARGIRILCDYLVLIGLLAKVDGRYGHSPTSAVFLDPRSPACMASISKFLGDLRMMEPSNNLTAIVRTGHTTLPGEGSVEPDNPVWVEFAESMGPMTGPVSGPLAQIALTGFSGPVRVLDIAAGHGLYGIGVALQNPQATIVALDWENVLSVAKKNAEKEGVANRFETLVGSAFDVEFGGPYDIVLLTNFLHHFDVPTCTALLRKVRAALKPGGCAATLEFVPNEDRVSPPDSAGFSLTMLISTPAGDAYTFRELEGMYREAGFGRIAAHKLPIGAQTVVTGHTA